MKNGSSVAAFEREFAQYVGSRYAIATANGTCSLSAALVALGVKPGEKVAVPPLTMAATSIAVLNVGAVPVFEDVDRETWTWNATAPMEHRPFGIIVSLYGLGVEPGNVMDGVGWVNDAAQTLKQHDSECAFTSFSFQQSKILALGEGGMLVTDDETLASRAREYLSLGYRMRADQPRIDPAALKSPDFDRHYSLGINGRMNDLTAIEGLVKIAYAQSLLVDRALSAACYRDAIAGCDWLTPQHVPDGWMHDYWTYAVALDSPARWQPFVDAIVRHGGERPYAAWKLTYDEPAFRHLKQYQTQILPNGEYVEFAMTTCPIAKFLQPRLVQFQTNNLDAADRNANALRRAIADLGP